MTDTPNKDLHCIFCKRGRTEVKILIAGQDKNTDLICNECVIKCYDYMVKATSSVDDEDEDIDIPSPREIKEFLDQYVIGQEQAKTIVAVAAHNHYNRIYGEHDVTDDDYVEIDKSNLLLIGKSGVGKTAIFTALAKLLDVPYTIADATSITEAGYVGDDAESIISRLLMAANGEVHKAETGIVFIDEIDKLRSQKSVNGRDVSGEGAQQSLLKLLEGSDVFVTHRGRRDGERIKINTKNILFIAGGAFVGIDEKENTPAGFANNVVKEENKVIDSEKLISYGLIPELVGRIPVIAQLDDLTEDQLYHILTQPKNAITKQFKKMFSLSDVQLDFEEAALRKIATMVINHKTGARGLRGIIEKILLTTQYNLIDLSEKGVKKVIVDENCILTGEPQLIY